jgi:hypothetical protein
MPDMEKKDTIVILIDALGYEIVEKHRFRPTGLSKPASVETVLGFSQAALTTILTGLEPDRHGLWMMYAFAGRRSPFGWLRMVPLSSERRLLRNTIRWVLDHIYRIDSYYSLYSIPKGILSHLDLPARGRMFGPGGADPARNIFDDIERRGGMWRTWDYRLDEEEAFDALERSVERGDGGFRLLYTAGLDAVMHRYGTGDERVGCLLEWYSDRIERIIAKSKGERVVVLGDHGMCDVRDHLDLIQMVDTLGLRIPGDFIPFYDSTMARFRVRTEGAGKRLKELLGGLERGHLLENGEAERLGVLYPDGRFGDLLFLVDPGTIILPSYMGKERVAAMHGYHPESPCMHSALLSNVETGIYPAALADIASYLLPGFEGVDRR